MSHESNEMNRRRLLRNIGVGAATAAAYATLGHTASVIAQPSVDKSFGVTTVNHLSYASANYKVTRDFYVDFFGMRDVWDDGLKCQLDCGPEDAPNSFYLTPAKPGTEPVVSHFSFGLPDYWNRANDLRDELKRR